jgi:hypothetical protein
MADYIYSVLNDFPNQQVNPQGLHQEILDESAITKTLNGVNVELDVCTIVFLQSLTAPEETALDGVVAAHDGTAILYIDPVTTHVEDTSGNPHNTTAAQTGAADSVHTHLEADITDLDHDAQKIQGVDVDDTDISNGRLLKYNSSSGNLEYEDEAAGSGDVTAAASITNHAVVRGDGGAKGVQDSLWFIDDDGRIWISASKDGYLLDIHNTKTDGGGFGFRILAGELAGDIAFHVADADDTFQIMEMEADQGYITLGKTVAQTIIDNGLAFCIDNQHDAYPESDFNTQIGTYRIAGVDVIIPAGGTVGQVLAKVNSTDYNTEWVDESGGGVFGSEFQEESSESESSTTSTSWQNMLDMDTPSLPSGLYRIGWYAEVRHSSTSGSVRARVELDGDSVTPYLGYIEIEPQDTDNWYTFSGFGYLTLDGTHDIDMDYSRVGASGTSYIRKARLEIWRIS